MIIGRLARALAPVLLMAVGCGDGPSRPSGAGGMETRGFRMGFSAFPPRPNETEFLPSVDLWILRADAAILHEAVPWAALLAGTSAETAVRALQPSYLGLAAETNLIRLAAPRPVYDAIVTMTNAASRDIAAAGIRVPLYVSAQVETAWGRFSGGGAFVGIVTDLRDFSFVTALGISSYPYLGGFAEPEQVPLDYYGRVNASRLPLLVVEGGWTSADVGGIVSSPDKQARWIRRQ